MKAYFLDTYSIIAMIEQGDDYISLSDAKGITSSLNIMEVYYYFLRKFNKQTAEYWAKNLSIKVIDSIPQEVTTEAAQFKFQHKKEKLSYVDCIGYIFAKKWKIKFLTGDREFETKENVEFVK